MRLFRVALMIAAVSVAQAAGAAPIDEVEPWITKLRTSIAAGRFDEVAVETRAVAAPDFPIDAIQSTIGDLAQRVDRSPADFTEVFDERNLGTFMKRVSIAVHYGRGYMFYALTFSHDRSGWQLVQFTYDPDVNKILALGWPT